MVLGEHWRIQWHSSSIAAGVVYAAEGLVLGFDLVLDGGAGHDAIELLHGTGDAGRDAARSCKPRR
jgi:hypothetical protein